MCLFLILRFVIKNSDENLVFLHLIAGGKIQKDSAYTYTFSHLSIKSMNRNSSNILPSPSPIASADHSRSQLSKHRRHGNDISDQEINLYKNSGKDG